MVHSTRVIITDAGLEYCPHDRPAKFIGMAPTPWYPGACLVDYGNGIRKCDLAYCRPLRLRERVLRWCNEFIPAFVAAGSPW